jgi:hypothetical protein
MLQNIFLSSQEQFKRSSFGEDQDTLKVLKNSGKIYHMVKELGRRLLSSSNPVVNSGFNDLSNLLAEFPDVIDE